MQPEIDATQPDGVTRLLLELAHESISRSTRVLVVDDPDGALTIAASELAGTVEVWCDSLLHERAVSASASGQERVTVVDSPSTADVALVRLPKSLSALAEICATVAQVANGRVFFAGRVKYMTPRQNEVISRYFAEVMATRGRYKSRGIVAREVRVDAPKDPDLWQVVDAQVGPHRVALHSLGATFGAGKVDFGSVFLLENLRPNLSQDQALTAHDLGCGNGIIAASLALRFPAATIIGSDISRSAVRSSNTTFHANGITSAHSVRSDALDHAAAGTAQLVVTNPPFHDGAAVDVTMSQRLFAGAGRALAEGGELWCVFNSMLRYRPLLRAAVGSTEVVAQNRKFTVTRSVKSGSAGFIVGH